MSNISRLGISRSVFRVVAICGLAVATLTAGLAPSPASAERRDHQRARQWRGNHYGGYYRHPGYYYAPPPTVYQPYGYYQQPGASLNFNFPFR